MNKNDKKMILCIIFICILTIFMFKILKKDNRYAHVYYENRVIKEIDLYIDNIYEVDGYNLPPINIKEVIVDGDKPITESLTLTERR